MALNGVGTASCDLTKTLYYDHTDSEGSLAQGNRDNISRKSAYFLSLVQMGVTAHSAYESLRAPNDAQKREAYKVVSAQHQGGLAKAIRRVRHELARASREHIVNTRNHWNRMLNVSGMGGGQGGADKITRQMTK